MPLVLGLLGALLGTFLGRCLPRARFQVFSAPSLQTGRPWLLMVMCTCVAAPSRVVWCWGLGA